jgi:hypothetical protein
MPILRLLALCLVLTPAFCQTLLVEGLGGRTVNLPLADIEKLPQKSFETQDHGKPAHFTGVALMDVLARVDLPLGDKFHLTGASYYLQVEAHDGYRAVFAWAELDPSFMDKPIYLVTRRDGAPLAAKDGPLQLVVPGEKRGGRWVRQVSALRLRRAL